MQPCGAAGVTDVRLVDYVAASWAGMLPGTFAYVYLGSVGKEAVSAAGSGGLDNGAKVALYGGRARRLAGWQAAWRWMRPCCCGGLLSEGGRAECAAASSAC
jgi:uncharacterized membrane protein YdjX (TVP38/TMEM64 family)